jgi:hypothetical protein
MRRNKVLKDRHGVIVVKEPRSNFCGGCRQWVVSDEAVAVFSEVDGEHRRVLVWKCPACRGDAPAESVEVASVSGVDVSKDERLGPYRSVVSVKLNASGKTARAALACGHECCALPDATRARCRKCRPGKKGGDA